jgi:hypothetical protein
VLLKLNIQLRTPTPPISRGSEASAYHPHTPANVHDLNKQASSIKAFLKQRSRSPPSPTHAALNQLIKGFQKVIERGIFLEDENQRLHAANNTQRQKRARVYRWTAHDDGLSIREAQELEEAYKVSTQATQALEVLQAQDTKAPSTRRPPRCSKCWQIGHKRNTCKASE